MREIQQDTSFIVHSDVIDNSIIDATSVVVEEFAIRLKYEIHC